MHSVHKMRPIAIDGAAWSVCVPVCYSRLWALKTAEPIEMPFGRVTRVGQKHILFHGSQTFMFSNTDSMKADTYGSSISDAVGMPNDESIR